MTSQNKQYFVGTASFIDAHDTRHTGDGNVTWLNEFSPSIEGSEKRIAEVLLQLFHTLGLCRAIAGEFALYKVSQEECARLPEGVPYAKIYRYNPKHLCPKWNGYGDNGQRSLKL